MRPGTGLPVVEEGLESEPYMVTATGACCLGQPGKVRGGMRGGCLVIRCLSWGRSDGRHRLPNFRKR